MAGKGASLQWYETGDRHPLYGKPLVERELEVLQRLANGTTQGRVAHELFLSLDTVRWHTQRARAKLGVGTTMGAACEALRRGLIE